MAIAATLAKNRPSPWPLPGSKKKFKEILGILITVNEMFMLLCNTVSVSQGA
jgi:hypothetical protein